MAVEYAVAAHRGGANSKRLRLQLAKLSSASVGAQTDEEVGGRELSRRQQAQHPGNKRSRNLDRFGLALVTLFVGVLSTERAVADVLSAKPAPPEATMRYHFAGQRLVVPVGYLRPWPSATAAEGGLAISTVSFAFWMPDGRPVDSPDPAAQSLLLSLTESSFAGGGGFLVHAQATQFYTAPSREDGDEGYVRPHRAYRMFLREQRAFGRGRVHRLSEMSGQEAESIARAAYGKVSARGGEPEFAIVCGNGVARCFADVYVASERRAYRFVFLPEGSERVMDILSRARRLIESWRRKD